MYDLFKGGEDLLRHAGAYLPPFSSRSFYRIPDGEEGEALVPAFTEALQRLMQIHIHSGDPSFGGYTCSPELLKAEFRRRIRNDFEPSLLAGEEEPEETVSAVWTADTGELRCGCARGGKVRPMALPGDGRPGCTEVSAFFALLAWGSENLEKTGKLYRDCLDTFSAYRNAYITGGRTSSLERELRSRCLQLQRELKKECSPGGRLRCAAEKGGLSLPSGDISPSGTAPVREETDISALKGAFSPCAGRAYTDEEESMIPVIPSWYRIPPQAMLAARAVKETSSDAVPFRNFLFRGDAGTGKTEAAKMLAYLCGLPYCFITCSADSEIYDLLMQVIPEPSSSGGLSYRYVDSPLVKAMERGYLLEIQEPSVISKPGVLAGLNAIWDRPGEVHLMDGRTVKRHPDCVIVMTTNSSYEGCRRMNQSVISRQDLIMDFDLPDDETLIGRICGLSGYPDRDVVERMLKVKRSVDSILNENGVSDGDTGVRQLIHWASLIRVTGEPYLAAMNTLIPGATADPEVRIDLINALESQFSPAGEGRSRNYA